MKKLLAHISGFIAISLLLLIVTLVVKTVLFDSKQIAISPVEPRLGEVAAAERLAQAVRIPTNSWTSSRIDTPAFVAFIEYVEQTFPLVDSFLARELVNDYSLLYHWRGTDPNLEPILLMGHYDVVPVEEASLPDWEQGPYSGLIEDGMIWGRGTMDDKMAVIGILETAERLLQEGFQPKRGLYFAFGHDEEVSGKRGAGTMSKMLAAQGVQLGFVLDEGGMTIQNAMSGLSKPLSVVGVAEKGYLSLTLTAKIADGGHSSMPAKETAVSVLSHAIVRLSENPLPSRLNDNLSRQMFDYLGPEMDFGTKMVFANRWLFSGILEDQLSADPKTNATIRTTTAPTMINGGVKDNVLPTEASAQVNFRLMPGDTKETVIAYLKGIISDERVSIEPYGASIYAEASPVSPTDAFGFKMIQQTIGEIMPESVVIPNLSVGATDARYYAELSDQIYRYSPMFVVSKDLTRMHGKNERLSVENYLRMIAFYDRLIRNSCE
ncbi:MAG: M20 family peptidase [Bacteroidota bacterium]